MGSVRLPTSLGGRLGAIAAVAVVMIVVIALVMPSPARGRRATLPPAPDAAIAAEADVFAVRPGAVAVGLDAEVAAGGGRGLAARRALRAYPGAPPAIPHAVSSDEQREQACTACHARGGYAPRFGRYAPISPHPAWTNCLQCHVPRTADGLFAATDFRPVDWPALGAAALDGAPPPIPHGLQLRGSCLSCHGGPAAPVEIRTSHPERANCRQCHVTDSGGDAFTRPAPPDSGGAR